MSIQITINDIAAVVSIIDAVSTRGAIKGDELSAVGALRNKFAAVVAESQKLTPAQQPVDDQIEEVDSEDE